MSRADFVGIGLNPLNQQKTAPTGPSVFPPLTSEGIEPDISALEHTATIGSRAPERQKRGGRAYAGDLEGGVRPMSTGVLLSMAFGSPVSSTEIDAARAPGVYRHRWNPLALGKTPLASTLWTVNVDEDPADPAKWIVDEYIGTMLNELGFTIEPNDYLLFTGSVQAIRNLEDVTPPVATRDSTELWSFDEIGAQISVPSINAGAYSPIALLGWNMSFSNNLAGSDGFQIGSKEIVKLRPGNIESTVGFTPAENLESHYRRAIADRPELVKMRLDAKGRQFAAATGDGLGPNAAIHEALAVEFMGLEYQSGNIAIDAGETLESVEVEANAVMDNAGDLLVIELVNQHDGSKYLSPAA